MYIMENFITKCFLHKNKQITVHTYNSSVTLHSNIVFYVGGVYTVLLLHGTGCYSTVKKQTALKLL